MDGTFHIEMVPKSRAAGARAKNLTKTSEKPRRFGGQLLLVFQMLT